MPIYLQLLYSSKNKSLFFSDCDIQEVIQRNIDILRVVQFSGLVGPEDDEFMEVRKLYYYHTYWDLIYLNDDHGYRFFQTYTLFENGIRMYTDLNLTSIFADSENDLFEFITPSLLSFGLDAEKTIAHIKTSPAEWLAVILHETGELKFEKWSEELREEFLNKSWSEELNEEGVPEMIPF